MGVFNSLEVTIACPACAAVTPREIQFRYGAVWQYGYVLGDTLRWDHNAVGDPALSDVVVDAWLCECPACDHEVRIAMYVRDRVLDAVDPVLADPEVAGRGIECQCRAVAKA